MTAAPKSACFFGIYDPGYARNRVLMQGFRENGWHVLECRADPRRFPGVAKYRELYRQYRRIRHEHPDLILVAYPGHSIVPFARLLFGNRIVFDAFVSLYDSNVFDRKVHFAHSIAAWLDWLSDWLSCRLAGTVLLDTDAHIGYFVETFGIPREKFIRVFIGSDLTPVLAPRTKKDDTCVVHFHGTYIPLHGIETIVEAARLVEDVPLTFRLYGRGQEYADIQRLAGSLHANLAFDTRTLAGMLPATLAHADICLGIFGATAKAARVIPNKVYECLAAGRATITMNSPAVRELETYGELPLVLVPPADPVALAAAIRSLFEDSARREALGRAAAAFAQEYFTPVRIVRELLAGLPPRLSRPSNL